MITDEWTPPMTNAGACALLGLMADTAKALGLGCAERDIRWAIESISMAPLRSDHVADYLRRRARNEFRLLPFWAKPVWFGGAAAYCLGSGRAYASAAFVVQQYALELPRW